MVSGRAQFQRAQEVTFDRGAAFNRAIVIDADGIGNISSDRCISGCCESHPSRHKAEHRGILDILFAQRNHLHHWLAGLGGCQMHLLWPRLPPDANDASGSRGCRGLRVFSKSAGFNKLGLIFGPAYAGQRFSSHLKVQAFPNVTAKEK